VGKYIREEKGRIRERKEGRREGEVYIEEEKRKRREERK
jgi:hypothetical protein